MVHNGNTPTSPATVTGANFTGVAELAVGTNGKTDLFALNSL